MYRAISKRHRYNRNVILRISGLVLAAVLLAGCQRGTQNNEAAVRQGVMDYLSHRAGLNISQMSVEVTSVKFQGDNQAEATVAIRPKTAEPSAPPMEIRYTLERQGERWVVKGKGRGQEQHGMGMMPPAQPQQLPPGHPAVGQGGAGKK